MSFADSNERAEIVKKFRTHESDTGSPEVQIALLTKRLEQMTEHFKTHSNDTHSRRGMMAMIARRKRLLQYLKNEDVNRYKNTIAALGLRK
jgi:small subunit ribosomal protein S15